MPDLHPANRSSSVPRCLLRFRTTKLSRYLRQDYLAGDRLGTCATTVDDDVKDTSPSIALKFRDVHLRDGFSTMWTFHHGFPLRCEPRRSSCCDFFRRGCSYCLLQPWPKSSGVLIRSSGLVGRRCERSAGLSAQGGTPAARTEHTSDNDAKQGVVSKDTGNSEDDDNWTAKHTDKSWREGL